MEILTQLPSNTKQASIEDLFTERDGDKVLKLGFSFFTKQGSAFRRQVTADGIIPHLLLADIRMGNVYVFDQNKDNII